MGRHAGFFEYKFTACISNQLGIQCELESSKTNPNYEIIISEYWRKYKIVFFAFCFLVACFIRTEISKRNETSETFKKFKELSKNITGRRTDWDSSYGDDKV